MQSATSYAPSITKVEEISGNLIGRGLRSVSCKVCQNNVIQGKRLAREIVQVVKCFGSHVKWYQDLFSKLAT